jgi:hypothetical protein
MQFDFINAVLPLNLSRMHVKERVSETVARPSVENGATEWRRRTLRPSSPLRWTVSEAAILVRFYFSSVSDKQVHETEANTTGREHDEQREAGMIGEGEELEVPITDMLWVLRMVAL